MLNIKIKPIDKWIGKVTKNPGWSSFRSTYSQTKKLLKAELEKANAIWSTIQLEMFIRPQDLRRDGTLRAHVKPDKQGVILSFTVKTKTGADARSFPCDTYNDWQDNLRGIALSMEKLRAVSRYGVFEYENMLGRLSLGAASSESSLETAFEYFETHGLRNIAAMKANENILKAAIRGTLKKFHPDNQRTGNADKFRVAQSMRQIIGV